MAHAGEQGELQRLVDSIFPPGVSSAASASKIDVVTRAEIFDLDADVMEVVEALPSRRYTRQRLCDQLNSIVVAHGWATELGTVE